MSRSTRRCERGRPLSQPSPQQVPIDQTSGRVLIDRTSGQVPIDRTAGDHVHLDGTSARDILVVVLAGFLGSGKTTLLNHLLHRSGGSRIGAVVNDFGLIQIDAMAVAGALGTPPSRWGTDALRCAVDASELDEYRPGLTPALGPYRRHRHRGERPRRAAGARADGAGQ